MMSVASVMSIAAIPVMAVTIPIAMAVTIPISGHGKVLGAEQLQSRAIEAKKNAVRGRQRGDVGVFRRGIGAVAKCLARSEAGQDLMRTIGQRAAYLATAAQDEPGSLGKLAAVGNFAAFR